MAFRLINAAGILPGGLLGRDRCARRGSPTMSSVVSVARSLGLIRGSHCYSRQSKSVGTFIDHQMANERLQVSKTAGPLISTKGTSTAWSMSASMAKYLALSEALDLSRHDRVRFSFAEIEDILLFPLPSSAHKYRAWWSNDGSHVQASKGWLSTGWTVKEIDLAESWVVFERNKKTKKQGRVRARTRRGTGSVSNYRDFESVAGEVMSERYGKRLKPGTVPPAPKLFDFVSDDLQVVGDAKYFTMVRGKALPPAKFSVVAEHVWLLDKVDAEHKFLVFGNDRRVPEEWLRRYGQLAASIEFYFLDTAGGQIERLNDSSGGRPD